MKNKSTLVKVGVGVGCAVAAVGVIALGVKIGNSGLKSTMDEWKEEIRDKLDTDKNNTSTPSTPSTSTQANLGEFIEFVD